MGVQFLFTAGARVCVCVCIRVRSRARVRSVRRFFEKAVAFRTLIEIISMRIEPSQLTSVLRDYPCVSPNSTSPSAFTFPGFFFFLSNNREHLFGCNMKEQVLQIVEGPVVPREADQQPAVKLTFCKDDSSSFRTKCFAGTVESFSLVASVKLIEKSCCHGTILTDPSSKGLKERIRTTRVGMKIMFSSKP